MTQSNAARNSDQTRNRILGEATQLFAKRGYHGTSVNQIVEGCGVNKRMVYHYFRDKQGLYREVFVQQWENLGRSLLSDLDRRIQETESSQQSLKILDRCLAGLFDYMAAHTEFVRLLTWEGLEGGAISRSIWKDVRAPLFQQVMELVEKAKLDGMIAKDLNAGHMVTLYLGAVVFYFSQAGSIGDLIGGDPLTEKHRRVYQKHMIATLRGLTQNPSNSH